MPDDVKINVRTPGARRAKRDLREVAGGEKKIGDAAQTSGRKATKSFQRTEGVVTKLASRLKALLAGYLGLAGAKMVLTSLRMETERIDEATQSATESLRSLLALSALKGERPEVQKSVWQMAAKSGRKIGEVAPAYYTLMGGTAGMDKARQAGLMKQALLMGKTDPRASLDDLVNLFTTIASQQPGMAPQEIGNLISRTIEQAKSTPGEMAQYLPDVLTAAQVGGVPASTAAAMFSFATRKGGGVAKSGQAAKSALLGLLAPTDAAKKQMAQYGFPVAGDLSSRVAWLAANAGRMPPELQAALGGRRGIQAVSSIAAAPGEFATEQRLMREALAAPGSLLKQRMEDLYGEVPAQRYFDQIKQIESLHAQEDVKPDELREVAKIKMRKLYRRKTIKSPAFRGFVNWVNDRIRDVTGSPGEMGENTIQGVMERLVEEGYEPADIMNKIWPELKEADVLIEFGQKEMGVPSVPVSDYYKHFKGILDASGAKPMQSDQSGGGFWLPSLIQQYSGGTHYHNEDRRDPAGRARPPKGQY